MHRGAALLALAAGGVVLPVLVRPGEGPKPGLPRAIPYRTTADVIEILKQHWREAGSPPLVGVALAAEGSGERGQFTLLEPDAGPPIEAAALAAALKTSRVHLLEVRVASALGAPRMPEADRSLFCAGASRPREAILVVAPEGTLATAFAIQDHRGEWMAAVSEGQRLQLRPEGDREALVVEALWKNGRRSVGSALCRSGLAAIYAALAEDDARAAPAPLAANEICDQANAGDSLAREATGMFSSWLGDFARQAAMMMAARGGVYLAGPLVRMFGASLDAFQFERRFRRSIPADSYLDQTPVWRATGSTALRGLSTLFSASDARVDATGVLMLDC